MNKPTTPKRWSQAELGLGMFTGTVEARSLVACSCILRVILPERHHDPLDDGTYIGKVDGVIKVRTIPLLTLPTLTGR